MKSKFREQREGEVQGTFKARHADQFGQNIKCVVQREKDKAENVGGAQPWQSFDANLKSMKAILYNEETLVNLLIGQCQ